LCETNSRYYHSDYSPPPKLAAQIAGKAVCPQHPPGRRLSNRDPSRPSAVSPLLTSL